MDTRSRAKGSVSPFMLSQLSENHSEPEDELDIGHTTSNGSLNQFPNKHGKAKCRLSLMGTAILERESEPILSATYNYWTDQAGSFFHESVNDFQRIELSKVSFGVNAYKGTSYKKRLNNGIISQNTWPAKAINQSGYKWAQTVVPRRQKWFRTCNTFAVGFASCMLVVATTLFLLNY